jgi:hypothetical protein
VSCSCAALAQMSVCQAWTVVTSRNSLKEVTNAYACHTDRLRQGRCSGVHMWLWSLLAVKHPGFMQWLKEA